MNKQGKNISHSRVNYQKFTKKLKLMDDELENKKLVAEGYRHNICATLYLRWFTLYLCYFSNVFQLNSGENNSLTYRKGFENFYCQFSASCTEKLSAHQALS